ncbi:porin [Mucilaginibacter sp. BJC16-A38]|uniref:porin n=1 Tax=Mucilaginibacter phenanthrenivorans TaxID=1234842 RepID=UPI002157CF4D|nr:porin [Mucilaginibacter phenanthrenivorans]MCR8557172.1 porin [Mucilaginibacter phenanthrenivorans]
MKKKLLLLVLAVSAFSFASKAQDTIKTTGDAPLVVYGSVDTYWKYDFSKHANIGTYFASDNNSVSLGMIDLGLKKKVGKASFVGELAFGPRGQYQSTPNGDGNALNANNTFNIQNLYVSFDVTDKFNLTAGYMATFVGYEVISPTGNFNYSTSYLFGAGPFQNAGFKATYAFSDKVSLMAGIFNDQWNSYAAVTQSYTDAGGTVHQNGEVSTFGAQLMVAPVKGWTAYINFMSGKYSGTIEDLTTTYQITDAFKLGLNAANKTGAGAADYVGAALYPQLAVSKVVTLGIRGESFKLKSTPTAASTTYSAFTLTANIKSGPLTFIPEIRFDHNKDMPFTDSSFSPTKTASQFVLAAVYGF